MMAGLGARAGAGLGRVAPGTPGESQQEGRDEQEAGGAPPQSHDGHDDAGAIATGGEAAPRGSRPPSPRPRRRCDAGDGYGFMDGVEIGFKGPVADHLAQGRSPGKKG